MSAYPTKVLINDTIYDSKDAKISVFDRGFLFGDGIYEAMVQLNGKLFFEKEHLERLDYCLKEIQIEFDVSTLKPKIAQLLASSGLATSDCFLYIQVTRGVAPRKHSFPKDVKPTLMMYAIAKELPEVNDSLITVNTIEDFRWNRCDLKSISILGNVMANDLAISNENYETLFVRDFKITEASHCNVFFVKGEVLYTHPANQFILNGITRIIVKNLCQKLNIKLIETAVHINDIATMDEAFLTGTATQIARIKKIDDIAFDTAIENSVTERLQQAFVLLKNDENYLL